MTDIQSRPKCDVLAKEVPLEAGKEPLGSIQPKPITDRIHTYTELRYKLEKAEKVPVYLDRVGDWVCAYPIKLHDAKSQSFTQKIQKEKFANLPPTFGIPTQLNVEDNSRTIHGVFYDQAADRFYARATQGGIWYLVGDAINYDLFLGGISQFASHLYETWKYNSSFLYSMIDWKLEEEPLPPPSYPPDEADSHIKKFLPWLKNFDSELYEEMKNRVEYIERFPVEESPWCEGPEKTRSFAYYEADSDKVFLMPNGIQLLEKGEYEKVAQIFAHEKGHRRSFVNRLVNPSGEMLTYSLGRFLGRVSHSGWLNKAWVYLFGDSTFRNLQCRLLPIIPEEEMHAFVTDYRYAHQKGLEKKHPDFIQDQVDFMDNLKEIMDRDFPPAWSFLASQYFFLAQNL